MEHRTCVLPVDDRSPITAILAIMAFPGDSEKEAANADKFHDWMIRQGLLRAQADGVKLCEQDQHLVSAGPEKPPRFADQRILNGQWVGTVLATYFWLSVTQPELASIRSAIKIAQRFAAESDAEGCERKFYGKLSQLKSAAHLWAAFVVRGCAFRHSPTFGLSVDDDLPFFLAEAEVLRDWGQNWRSSRDKAEPPLSQNVWRVPDGWRPPPANAFWPAPGFMPLHELNERYLRLLRTAGRPRKN